MKNMVLLFVSFKTATFLILFFSAHEALTSITGSEVTKIEDIYNKTKKTKEAWKLYTPQSFLVRLSPQSSTKEFFITMLQKNSVTEFPESYEFAIIDLKSVKLKKVLTKPQQAVTEIFSFQKVDAVSFKDINGDGIKDIFAIISYFDSRPVQGEGVGGGKTTIALGYLSKGEGYVLKEDCADKQTVQKVQECVKAL